MGSAVGKIRAHDLDSEKNAEVEYSIVPGDEGHMFNITSNGHSQEGIIVLSEVGINNPSPITLFYLNPFTLC